MRAWRGTVIGLLSAGLLAVPALPASAGPEHCPQAVLDARGEQPSLHEVDAWLTASAAAHDVPLPVLKVIAYKESTWRQFKADGSPLISSDGVCGVGVMQVTVDEHRTDGAKLASDAAYNIDEGAKILRQKWELSQQTKPPNGYPPEDPDVVENWFSAICRYNGCVGANSGYASHVADILHNPFAHLNVAFREFIRPSGFTKPQDADTSYTYPNAFYARQNPDEFVFYDHLSGVVSKVVPARTHRWSAPPVVAYPDHTIGPDHQWMAWSTQCTQCAHWRLAEGSGLSGRAQWTLSVTGDKDLTTIRWSGFNIAGRMRVDAYIPALGTDTLGTATYTFVDSNTARKTVTIDQNARKGDWTTLGDVTFWTEPKVTMGDRSNVAGRKLVADAVRIVPLPGLTLTTQAPYAVDYGTRRTLTAKLTNSSYLPMENRAVRFYRRVRGTAAWQGIGAWQTNVDGAVAITVTPDRNYEYTTRFVPNPGEYLAPAASGDVRLDVRPRVGAAFSRSGVVSGQSTTLSTAVTPSHRGQVVQFQRFYGGMWRTVATRTLDAYSRASWTFAMTTTKTCGSYDRHLFRVVKPADADHLAAVSPTRELVVRRAC